MFFRFCYWSMPIRMRNEFNFSIDTFKERYLQDKLSNRAKQFVEEFKERWE